MTNWKHDYEQVLARGVREDTYAFEAILLSEISRGNTAAFDAVVAVHSGRIFRLAKRVVKNDDDAFDVAQDVYLTMHRKLPEFRGDSEIGSWLHRVTCNAALMHVRKNSRHTGHLTDDALETISNLEKTEESVSNRQILQQLGKAFRRLSKKHQVVLEMRVAQDLSVGEMAQTLGLSVPATKSRIHRARLALLSTAGLV
jgi:RNA polymerase sigma-70 factor (ECF subfamily)